MTHCNVIWNKNYILGSSFAIIIQRPGGWYGRAGLNACAVCFSSAWKGEVIMLLLLLLMLLHNVWRSLLQMPLLTRDKEIDRIC